MICGYQTGAKGIKDTVRSCDISGYHLHSDAHALCSWQLIPGEDYMYLKNHCRKGVPLFPELKKMID